MMEDMKREILDWVSYTDYLKGSKYDEDYIDFAGTTDIEASKRFQFLVQSESTYRKYMVQVETKNNHISRTYCTCPQFQANRTCKHIAACCILYSNKLFSQENDKQAEMKSLSLLRKLKAQLAPEFVRKTEVFITPYLAIENSYYRTYITLKLKIGQEKTYSLIGKFGNFKLCYDRQEEFKFGVNFTFDPKKHFLSEQSLKVLEMLDFMHKYYSFNGNSVILDNEMVKKLFEIYPDGVYLDETTQFLKIVSDFPFPINFTKQNSNYTLKFEGDIFDIDRLTSDLEYVLYNKTIYHLTKEQRLLLRECLLHDMDEIVFPEKQFNEFQKNVIRLVKDKIVLNETTKDIIIDSTPEVKFYFDLNEDSITCIPKFTYRNIEITYFDEVSELVRDIDFENNVVSNLADFGFHKMSRFFLLDDFDLMCEFMDGGLDEFANLFPVFTSENLKNTSIIKKNAVSSTFHIGKDNILRFDFDLGAISNDEIDAVMMSMKSKKKYYRLKNGNILDLNNDSLKELQNLTEDLEISSKDMLKGEGTIPKYRALYLDSLKANKYDIIKTDSMFQQFINQFKEYQNVDVKFTKEETDTLRDYQEEGVKWLYTIAKCGFGGILADEMGLGKSLQTIYFFQKLLEEEPNSKFLIVCPTSLVYNWENEFQKFAPHIKNQVFSGNRNDRHKLLEEYDGNVYITSYGLLREDLEFYDKKTFKVFVIDEAQNIKNPKTGLTKAVKSVNAETKLALTGTPIENSIVELWSIFDFIMPGFLSSLMKFQQKYKVKDFDEDTNKLLERLKLQVRPFILRRKKSDVIKDLPDKIENNIYIDLNEEQKKLYAAEVKYVNDQMDMMIKNGGFDRNKMLILRLLTRLRQLCVDPSILFETYKGGSAKIENLIKIIKEVVTNGHKILLFTSFKTALNIVKDALDEENISNYTIAGDVPSKKRQMLVDAFNKDNTDVFLIMLKSGGTGLNLTSADVVIHLDLWWNPQAENQATDRTHRIGQTKNVEVIKLICKGTIEEKILDLQQKKKILSDKILESEMDDSSYLKNLGEDDIRHLLAYENKD